MIILTAFSAPAWGQLLVTISTDRPVDASGQPIVMTLKVINQGSMPVTLAFPTSQRYDFIIENSQGKEVWRWSAERLFLMVLGQERLDENKKELIYSETFTGILPLGRYTLKGKVVSRPQGYEATAAFQIE